VAPAGRRWRLVRADPDAVPASVRRFMRRARRRRLRAALPWAVVGGLLSLAALVAWLVYGTALLGVREIQVLGAELVTVEEVRHTAAVPVGTPLVRVDLDAVRARVANLAPVERVNVVRQWPGTLRIELLERTAVAVVPRGREFAVLDRTGVEFRTLTEAPKELPLLRVAEGESAELTTRGALRVIEALTPELRELLVRVVADGPARIRLELTEGRTVVWGDAARSETKAQVATALLARPERTVDVSSPDVVTLR
jgi:cell division protein FtsQ